MSELTRSLTADEQIILGQALDKLFNLQDRPVSEKKISLFVQELSSFPLAPLLSAIRSLQAQDLKNIKIAVIIEETEKFLEPATPEPCDHCQSSGAITMKDEEGHYFALACVCANAHKYRRGKSKLVRWKRTDTQESKGRLLVRA